MKFNQRHTFIGLSIFLVIAIFSACKKMDLPNQNIEQDAIVNIRFNSYQYDTGDSNDIGKISSSERNRNVSDSISIRQVQSVMKALESSRSNNSSNNKNFKDKLAISKMSSLNSADIGSGIGYIVVAFHKDTKLYAGEAFYIAGREYETTFKLKGGEEYIFVAFSYDWVGSYIDPTSNDEIHMIPHLKFMDYDDKILDNAYISGFKIYNPQTKVLLDLDLIPGSSYYVKNENYGPLSVDEPNEISLTLKQQNCLVNFVFDTEELSNIDSIKPTFFETLSPNVIHSETMAFLLNDGVAVYDGRDINDPKRYFNSSSHYHAFYFSTPTISTDILFTELKYRYTGSSNMPMSNIPLLVKNVELKAGARYTIKIKVKPGASTSSFTAQVEYITEEMNIEIPIFY